MNSQYPQILYKYRNCSDSDCSIENLKNSVVWCSTLDNYNDPYEGYSTISFLPCFKAFLSRTNKYNKEYLNSIGNIDELINFIKKECPLTHDKAKEFLNYHKKIFEKKRKMYRDMNIQSTAICSFSEENNNGLMWAHYSDSHKGFCIAYDTEQMQNNLYKVNYAKKIFNITDEFVKALKSNENYVANNNLAIQMCTQKDIIWEYEKEWRIIFSEIDKNPEIPSANQENKGFLYNLTPKAVYLGSKMKNNKKEQIVKIAKEQNLDIYEMEMDNDNYILLPKKIF